MVAPCLTPCSTARRCSGLSSSRYVAVSTGGERRARITGPLIRSAPQNQMLSARHLFTFLVGLRPTMGVERLVYAGLLKRFEVEPRSLANRNRGASCALLGRWRNHFASPYERPVPTSATSGMSKPHEGGRTISAWIILLASLSSSSGTMNTSSS